MTDEKTHLVSDDLIEAYVRDGYAVVPGLIPDADLQHYRQRLEAIVEGSVPAADDMVIMRDIMVAKGKVEAQTALEAVAKIQFYENDPVLDAYTRHVRILDCVERFIGPEIQTIHTMLINKPPNVQGHHPLHQDLLYFPFRPPERITASWTALEPVTRENGCLVVVPGTHRGKLLAHGNPAEIEWLNVGYWGASDIGDAKQRRVHLEMEPGDTVFFHPLLLHGSGRNRTQGFRRAISAHYAAVDVAWGWSCPEIYPGRKFRILRGPRAGQLWDGAQSGGDVDPLEYLDFLPEARAPGARGASED